FSLAKLCGGGNGACLCRSAAQARRVGLGTIRRRFDPCADVDSATLTIAGAVRDGDLSHIRRAGSGGPSPTSRSKHSSEIYRSALLDERAFGSPRHPDIFLGVPGKLLRAKLADASGLNALRWTSKGSARKMAAVGRSRHKRLKYLFSPPKTPALENLFVFLVFMTLTSMMTWPWVLHLRDATND